MTGAILYICFIFYLILGGLGILFLKPIHDVLVADRSITASSSRSQESKGPPSRSYYLLRRPALTLIGHIRSYQSKDLFPSIGFPPQDGGG